MTAYFALFRVVLSLQSVNIQMKAIEQYFHVVSCGLLCCARRFWLSFKSVDETLLCDHSNESYNEMKAILSPVTRTWYYLLCKQGVLNPGLFPFKWSNWTVCCYGSNVFVPDKFESLFRLNVKASNSLPGSLLDRWICFWRSYLSVPFLFYSTEHPHHCSSVWVQELP